MMTKKEKEALMNLSNFLGEPEKDDPMFVDKELFRDLIETTLSTREDLMTNKINTLHAKEEIAYTRWFSALAMSMAVTALTITIVRWIWA